jgi:hypothetical protein
MITSKKIGIVRLQVFSLIVFLLWPFTIGLSADKQAKRESHHQLKAFEKFLDAHPAIAADINKDAALVDDPDYLAKHPELKDFLDAHPGLRNEILAKAGRCSLAIPSIFDRASPAVVYIYATSINP